MMKHQQVHETVDLLFKRDGVPNVVIIMDGAREQVYGQMRKECQRAGVHGRQAEPDTTFANAAEASMRELKKGVRRQLVQSKAPTVLWEHCVERQAYVGLNTAHDIYQLDGQVPETMMSGETADITAVAVYQWYE
jgi:hypothetical protein